MIQHLQSGGNLFFNAIGSYAKAQQAVAAENNTKTTKKDSGLISEKLMLKLQENGIPVDVDNFMNKLASVEEDIDLGFGVNKRALYSLQADANRIIQQASYLKQAESNAEKNESLGEVAVGGRGELFILDGNEIKSISPSEYDMSKHGAAMTVGELIEHRKFNPTRSGDIQLTRVINDNIGMSKINEYLQKIIATVGSATSTQEAYIDLAGYVGKEAAKKPTTQQLESLQRVYSIISQYGPNALFKLRNTAEGKNLEEAFNYIQQVLPRNMKIQLIGRNVAAGNSFETGGKYISDLISSALYSGNKTKQEEYISYEDSLNRSISGTKGDQNRNLGVLEQLVQGSLGKRDYKLISSKNPEVSMTLHGNGIGALSDFDNNMVDKTPLSIAMKSGLGALVDQNHVFIGDQKVPTGAFDTILYNGGDVINVWAPVDGNGDIDFNQLQIFNEIQKIIEQNPQLTTEDKNRLLRENGLDGQYDQQGTFHGGGQMGQFIVMTGLTSDEVIDPEENIYADKLNKNEKDLEMTQIDRIYGHLNKGIKNKDAQFKFEKGWFNWSTDLVKAPIFMKLNNTAQIDVGTFSGKGPLIQTPSYQSQMVYDQMRYNRQNNPITIPSTQLIYE